MRIQWEEVRANVARRGYVMTAQVRARAIHVRQGKRMSGGREGTRGNDTREGEPKGGRKRTRHTSTHLTPSQHPSPPFQDPRRLENTKAGRKERSAMGKGPGWPAPLPPSLTLTFLQRWDRIPPVGATLAGVASQPSSSPKPPPPPPDPSLLCFPGETCYWPPCVHAAGWGWGLRRAGVHRVCQRRACCGC